MLEMEKWKSTNQILKLNRMIDESEGSLAKKRGEMAYMNQETGWCDNTGSLFHTYTEPNSYSIQLTNINSSIQIHVLLLLQRLCSCTKLG